MNDLDIQPELVTDLLVHFLREEIGQALPRRRIDADPLGHRIVALLARIHAKGRVVIDREPHAELAARRVQLRNERGRVLEERPIPRVASPLLDARECGAAALRVHLLVPFHV